MPRDYARPEPRSAIALGQRRAVAARVRHRRPSPRGRGSVPASCTRGRGPYSPSRVSRWPRAASAASWAGSTRASSMFSVRAALVVEALGVDRLRDVEAEVDRVDDLQQRAHDDPRAAGAAGHEHRPVAAGRRSSGDIDERGRLPGAGWLAVPASPKSVSSLLSRKPVPGAMTALPNSCSIVHVSATALPRRSMTDTWVVLPLGLRRRRRRPAARRPPARERERAGPEGPRAVGVDLAAARASRRPSRQLGHGMRTKSGSAEVGVAVGPRDLLGLGDEVVGQRRGLARGAQVVALEDVEHLLDGHAAGGRRRHAEHGAPAVGAGERVAPLRAVGGEVLERQQAGVARRGRGVRMSRTIRRAIVPS